MDLRDRVENKLAEVATHRLAPQDVLIEYNMRAHANGTVVHNSSGVIQLPAFLNPRLISTSEQKLQTAIYSTILEPLNADLLDVLESVPVPGSQSTIDEINQHIPQLPGN